MFNPDDLLNYFKGLLTAPEPVGAEPESVNLGNEPFCRGGKPLRFDVAAAPGEALPFTETLERRLWRVTLTATGTPGTGLGRVYAAARRAARLCAPFDARRGAFAVGGARFYVAGVSIETPPPEDGSPRAAAVATLIAESPRAENRPGAISTNF